MEIMKHETYHFIYSLKIKSSYLSILGLLVGKRTRVDYEPEPEPTDPTLKFYKSRVRRASVPTMDGKQPIYDFDAWYVLSPKVFLLYKKFFYTI